MKAHRSLRGWFLGLLFAALLAMPVGSVQGQSVPHLTVTLTGQTLTAGFNNNVTVTVRNDFYTTIYDVDFAVSIPSSLTMYGDSHWHYTSMDIGRNETINFQVYAPTAVIGTSYQGSITVSYKQLGDISYTQETHAISFSVQGWINLIVYGVQITPSTTAPGGNATLSGNLLNSGNLAAFNANVTVQSSILTPTPLSSVYLGEIDPNIPRPFSLLVLLKGNAREGNYSLLVRASAIDSSRPASPYSAETTANFQVKRASTQPSNQRGAGGIFAILFEILRYLMDVFFGSTSPFTLGHSIMLLAADYGRPFVRVLTRF